MGQRGRRARREFTAPDTGCSGDQVRFDGVSDIPGRTVTEVRE